MVSNPAAMSGVAPLRRLMRRTDLPQVLQIERVSYAYPWTRQIFKDCLASGYHCWVLEQGTKLQGYLIWSLALDEAHILNLCVRAEQRRQGWGQWLLRELCTTAYKQGARSLFLEVRPSNQAAVILYQNTGFCEVGLRQAYYPAPGGREDALIMAKSLSEEE